MPSIKQPDIDLRSDTVTRPSPAMRDAMLTARVGDDVYGDDPSVNALQDTAAAMLGKQAGLFLPSGTQSNLSAVLAHCERGDEYIIGDQFHIYRHEAGGTAVLGGTYPFVIPVTNGLVQVADIQAAIKPDDAHYPRSRLLCMENTVSGQAIAVTDLQAPAQTARAAGLKVHLDGARFFNAVVATGTRPQDMADVADTVSVCLSKGLGAPVGSVLVGDRATIARAHRIRKMLGGGLRQAGILAAAGLYALQHHVDRLADDHRRAASLSAALNQLETLWLQPVWVQTNMVFITPQPGLSDALFAHLEKCGIELGKAAPTKRLVIHLDIDDDKLSRVIESFQLFHKGQV
ncbi:MAG: low-specificity L-threonine aldolase [Burkholderiaceae bacterium]